MVGYSDALRDCPFHTTSKVKVGTELIVEATLALRSERSRGACFGFVLLVRHDFWREDPRTLMMDKTPPERGKAQCTV